MRHHPVMTKIVAPPAIPPIPAIFVRRAMLAVLFLFLIGFAPAHSRAQDAASNVARVSFVQGSVQLLAGQGGDFQQAVMNMPVVEGSQLQTGSDGQAD
jgi:hypothetical protein